MIIRFWLISGILLVGVAWYLVVPQSPASMQASPGSAAGDYREAGLLPEVGGMVMSREIGHGVFEIPEADAAHAAEAEESGGGIPGMDMPGMDMPGMDTPQAELPGMDMLGTDAPQAELPGMDMPGTDAPQAAMPGMDMPGTDAPQAAMPGMDMPGTDTPQAEMPSMDMPGTDAPQAAMPSMDMPGTAKDDHAEAPMAIGEPVEQPMQPMEMDEHAEEPVQPMAMGEPVEQPMQPMQPMATGEEMGAHGAAEEGEHMGGRGLRILTSRQAMGHIDREVTISMKEWEFESGNLTVKAGETIRLIVRNTGNIPHEFMFMPAEGMQAVNYRMERADWNLLEHEALFEREIVLPGDSFEVVMKIEQPGTWMYMCMFPFHMKFGMMGMMMTEGTITDSGSSMGGMKM